ncbi:hypothetical protein C4D60_Mb04t39070 [Musa balbisiana]|uniref:HHO5-like N-terminal domain-containing protein n=1 Tax=Musa balbisiana TaxID=52838 RepID=A0A4S8KHY6_MUSBA|nr:hypothetical protein C4D60_Mb04t39070 [Musa balbisiana]
MIEPAAMGSEVGLALQLCAMRTIGGFVKDAATESGGRAARLVESIKILEEEKRKIEAFQRELPLCMHLLGEVIDGLKKETERCGGGCFGRVLQELLPVESRVEEDGEVKVDDKMNWMSSAQLWSDNYGENDISHEHHEDGRRQGKENLFLECKSPGGDGAFLPFEALLTVSASSEEKKPAAALPDRRGCGRGPKSVGRAPESSPAPATVCGHLGFQSQHQPSRKARRCWSQELHRRFTIAIQQLGGAQGENIDCTLESYLMLLQPWRVHRVRWEAHHASGFSSNASVVHSRAFRLLVLHRALFSWLALPEPRRSLPEIAPRKIGKSDGHSWKRSNLK